MIACMQPHVRALPSFWCCCVQGRNGAVCVIALAERGALFDPGPCMYMEKLAVGPAVDPKSVSLDMSIKDNLEVVAKSLGKPIGYVSVMCPQAPSL